MANVESAKTKALLRWLTTFDVEANRYVYMKFLIFRNIGNKIFINFLFDTTLYISLFLAQFKFLMVLRWLKF